MPTQEIELTAQQQDAVDKVAEWYKNGHQQVFRLFGYAGTGKTTLARHIVDKLGLTNDALFAAYTGKAAFVLRTKGCASARTIHSLIYCPVDKSEIRHRITELKIQLQDEHNPVKVNLLRARIGILERDLASPSFVLNEESELADALLLVLDEVSMVDYAMAMDLLGFGTKLLVLGDPAQLPPVGGAGYFIDAEPDVLLDQIHRSALDSPVTRLATTIRNAEPGVPGFGVTGRDGDSGRVRELTDQMLVAADQVLVGKNATRWQMIHRIRALYGLSGPIPQAGDRIVVLANNREAGVFNGELFTTCVATPDENSPDVLHMLVADDFENFRMLDVWACGFENFDGERQAKENGRSRIVAATFAWALTTHKSQGSQWDNVLVIDESSVFGYGAYKDAIRSGQDEVGARVERHIAGRRWAYTAVTRAAEQVVITEGRF